MKLNLQNLFFFYENCNYLNIYPNTIEHAYLLILNDDLEKAKEIFKSIDSPRAHWGITLVSILQGFLEKYPTYFQVRNFFEIDLDFLLKNKKINYVELLLGSLDILSNVNQETYKYTARVMFENKLYTASLKYMDKSKEIFYSDAELHFMLAKYYFLKHLYSEALFYINECQKLIPDYYPAKILRNNIEEMCS